MKNITKAFPGVIALDNVDFGLTVGEIHALLGKNGAGKSTLISIISGMYIPDGGDISYENRHVDYHHLHSLPVATVYQESTLFPNLSVADNIFGGDEPSGFLSLVKNKEKIQETKQLLELFQLDISPLTPSLQLSPAEQKVLEILRAIRKKCQILILDEPTAALTLQETNRLFELLKGIKKTKVGIIYISHRLEEIFQVADRVTVLRDGKLQGCKAIQEMDMPKLVVMMVGKQTELEEVQKRARVESKARGTPRLEVKSLTHYFHKFRDISFSIAPGEILGIAGLVGAGKTELAKSIFGAEKVEQGEIVLDGKAVQIYQPQEAIEHGIVYVTESRKEEGLFLDMTIGENIASSALKEIAGSLGFIHETNLHKLAREAIDRFNIIAQGTNQVTNTLSGGNQQKVLLGIWLHLHPKVLIVDEPTTGIDVEAKTEIYKLLRTIAESGTAIILISAEIKEGLNNVDRIITMYNGQFTGEFMPAEVDENTVLEYISGLRKEEE